MNVRKYIAWTILLSIVILPIFFSIFFYIKYKTAVSNVSEKENEIKNITEKIEVYFELPKNEVPTIAEVVDADKLSTQSFFAKSKDGDKVLVYQIAGKAILYRPSTNRVIEVMRLATGISEENFDRNKEKNEENNNDNNSGKDVIVKEDKKEEVK